MVSAPPILREPPTRSLPNVGSLGIDRKTIPPELLVFLDFAGKKIEEELLLPLLQVNDPATLLQERWDIYVSWTSAVANAIFGVGGLERILPLIEQEEITLRKLFEERAEAALGRPASKSLNDALELQTLVRESLLETFQAAAQLPASPLQGNLATLVMARDLCLTATAYHLSTGDGNTLNAVTLAGWSFYYADLAYTELGFLSLDLGLGTKIAH